MSKLYNETNAEIIYNNDNYDFEELIEKCIDNNKSCIIEYEDRNGNITERKIKPFETGEYYYNYKKFEGFKAYCYLRNEERTFTFFRIKKLIIIEDDKITIYSRGSPVQDFSYYNIPHTVISNNEKQNTDELTDKIDNNTKTENVIIQENKSNDNKSLSEVIQNSCDKVIIQENKNNETKSSTQIKENNYKPVSSINSNNQNKNSEKTDKSDILITVLDFSLRIIVGIVVMYVYINFDNIKKYFGEIFGDKSYYLNENNNSRNIVDFNKKELTIREKTYIELTNLKKDYNFWYNKKYRTPEELTYHLYNNYGFEYEYDDYRHGGDYIQHPLTTFYTRRGDCDDYTILLMYYFRLAYGISANFVTVKDTKDNTYHALVEWNDTYFDLTWGIVYPKHIYYRKYPYMRHYKTYSYEEAMKWVMPYERN